MGRMMPTECEHGRILDWGSFGAEDGSSTAQECPECANQMAESNDTRRERAIARVQWILKASGASGYDHGLTELSVSEAIVREILDLAR